VPQKINRHNMARVKRCGKSTPVLLVTMNAAPLKAEDNHEDD